MTIFLTKMTCLKFSDGGGYNYLIISELYTLHHVPIKERVRFHSYTLFNNPAYGL